MKKGIHNIMLQIPSIVIDMDVILVDILHPIRYHHLLCVRLI